MNRSKTEYLQELGRSLIELVILIVVLIILRVAIPHIPTLEDTLEGIRVAGTLTGMEIARGLISAGIIATLVRFGLGIDNPLRNLAGSFREAGPIARNIVIIVAIAYAYISFQPLVEPILDARMWVFTYSMLGLSILMILLVLKDIVYNIGKMSKAISQIFVSERSKTREMEGKARTCPECGEPVSEGAEFCTNCGTELGIREEKKPKAEVSKCPECGAEVPEGAEFCTNCGTKI